MDDPDKENFYLSDEQLETLKRGGEVDLYSNYTELTVYGSEIEADDLAMIQNGSTMNYRGAWISMM